MTEKATLQGISTTCQYSGHGGRLSLELENAEVGRGTAGATSVVRKEPCYQVEKGADSGQVDSLCHVAWRASGMLGQK